MLGSYTMFSSYRRSRYLWINGGGTKEGGGCCLTTIICERKSVVTTDKLYQSNKHVCFSSHLFSIVCVCYPQSSVGQSNCPKCRFKNSNSLFHVHWRLITTDFFLLHRTIKPFHSASCIYFCFYGTPHILFHVL